MLLDSVTFSQPNDTWLLVATGILAALLGAGIAGVLALLLDAWRRTLDAIAASRLIRLEHINSQNTVSMALQGHIGLPPVSGEFWKKRIISLAPFLDEVVLSKMCRDMAVVGNVQAWVEDCRGTDAAHQKTRASLKEWASDVASHASVLKKFEARSKWRLMMRLVFGVRPATNAELLEGFKFDVLEHTAEQGDEPAAP
jgi:hypothetical protein